MGEVHRIGKEYGNLAPLAAQTFLIIQDAFRNDGGDEAFQPLERFLRSSQCLLERVRVCAERGATDMAGDGVIWIVRSAMRTVHASLFPFYVY